MNKTGQGPMTELLNAADVRAWLKEGGVGPVVIQAVDLVPLAADIAKVDHGRA